MKRHLMRITVLLLALCCVSVSQAAGGKSAERRLARQLEKAYKQNSVPRLNRFMEEWSEKYAPNGPESGPMNDTLRAVYELFGSLYSPNLRREPAIWPDSLLPARFRSDSLFPYVVVQPQIRYRVEPPEIFDSMYYGKDKSYLKRDREKDLCIEDFRPEVTIPGHKTVYLESAYIGALNHFAGSVPLRGHILIAPRYILKYLKRDQPLPPSVEKRWEKEMQKKHYKPDGHIRRPILLKEEKESRRFFLLNCFRVEFNVLIRDWQYGTPETIDYIVLNETLDKAIVLTREITSGNGRYMRKDGPEWVWSNHRFPFSRWAIIGCF